MTHDEQEARSTRHIRGLIIVPLRSGSFAIFRRDFNTLLAIVEQLDDALAGHLRLWADLAEQEAVAARAATLISPVRSIDDKLADELGI